MVRRTVQRQVATKKGWPKHSNLMLMHLLRPGDRLGGERIIERLVDEDGSVVFVMERGGYWEYPPLHPE